MSLIHIVGKYPVKINWKPKAGKQGGIMAAEM